MSMQLPLSRLSLALSFGFAVGSAAAAPGDLDPAFNKGTGFVLLPAGNGLADPVGIAICAFMPAPSSPWTS